MYVRSLAKSRRRSQRQGKPSGAVGFGPSILVTALFLSGSADAALVRLRERRTVQTIAPMLTADVNAIRFAGLAVWLGGCWLQQWWWITSGVLSIAAAWLLAWWRGTRVQPSPCPSATRRSAVS